MRKLIILKTLVHYSFIVSAIGLVFMIPLFFMLIVVPNIVPFKISGLPAKDLNTELLILLLFIITGYGFIVYALHLFKKVLELFSKLRIFDKDVILYFNQIGKAMLIGYFISAIPAFLYNLIAKEELDMELDLGFNSSLFMLGLSLFFMVLSEVFLIAKTIKEENDLTI
jgi:hypothetical protein